ncbi:MAG: single-stranded-DNA-specific exonuclease RecJ [Clostridia bacterium]|nr:single-stranded-DNA-specific exonuclease RecJ [Clostridia bacterium]
MKRILPEFEFSNEQLNIVRNLARECNLCEETVKILYGRGIRDKESIFNFMHPSKSRFISPFKMSGMREAVELITQARDEGWSVVVYGDYDADGICASTIMGRALRDFGLEPIICVPERRNGYGLSPELIDEIFDEYFPQLLITVDCGISCAEEVEYIKEMGAEVIITDHHELPERIPECICINPKFNDGYIYDNLCGAGVAFKVGCALIGEDAYKYLDFAAIATVADSVPLTGENRDIVYEGLQIINKNPSDCYAQFINRQDVINSQSIAFAIAPKINAAGRMGDAKSALTLFNETDKAKIFELSAKLAEYNIERQKCCDELYTSAKQMIRERGGRKNVIMLCNESWNSGFIGIVAARLAEEFSCPAILFVKNGGMLKGSARSVENVNIFEALRACSEFIAEFGGHSQAAGVNVAEENFFNLEKALEEYIGEHYSPTDFVPTVYVNGELKSDYPLKLIKELELLEPFGVGNRRPVFVAEESSLSVRTVKAAHISVKCDNLELMCFGGLKYKRLIESNAFKKFVFEYSVSNFRGKEYVKGIVRDIVYEPSARFSAEKDIALSGIELFSNAAVNAEVKPVSKNEIESLMKEGGFGTLFVAWDNAAVSNFENSNLLNCELFLPSSRSCVNSVLIAPSADLDLNGYKRVIFLNKVPVNIGSLEGREIEIYDKAVAPEYFKELSCERDGLLRIFATVSVNAGNLFGINAEEVAVNNGFENVLQTYFALKVFRQLGLINFEHGRLEVNKGAKSKLENSELYNAVKDGKAE